MGFARERPARLAEKLLQIRLALGLSQDDMLRRLGQDEKSYRFYISNYETGKREPSLLVLLEYARVANVLLEVLADDELNLPDTIPSPTRSEGIRRTSTRSKKTR
ncbi:MAG TPA: helix-turn-helix transcriptional regulator [Pyrinomonadaceae bacterium]|nr:helix-turn-helix transcriptional regulator [Pyrinomonadaceae bacterium]